MVDIAENASVNEGPAVKKDLNFVGIRTYDYDKLLPSGFSSNQRHDPSHFKRFLRKFSAPPADVKIRSVSGDVYEFEVVPRHAMGAIEFTYQVAEADSDFSDDSSSKGLAPFSTSEAYKTMNMKARICNDGLCSFEYFFNFTTNVGREYSCYSVVNFASDLQLARSSRLDSC